MAKTKYTYNITDFPNNKADAGKLYNTILENQDFTCMVDSINVFVDDVDIWFRASITPAEWATLSGIVAVHDGEEYIESIIIRQDNNAYIDDPTFVDTDVDKTYDIKVTAKLIQVIKSVQNNFHNKHDYVFKVIEIEKIKEK